MAHDKAYDISQYVNPYAPASSLVSSAINVITIATVSVVSNFNGSFPGLFAVILGMPSFIVYRNFSDQASATAEADLWIARINDA